MSQPATANKESNVGPSRYFRLRSREQFDGTQEAPSTLQELKLKTGHHWLELVITTDEGGEEHDVLFDKSKIEAAQNTTDAVYVTEEQQNTNNASVVANLKLIQKTATGSSSPISVSGQARDDHTVSIGGPVVFEMAHEELLIIGEIITNTETFSVDLSFGLTMYG